MLLNKNPYKADSYFHDFPLLGSGFFLCAFSVKLSEPTVFSTIDISIYFISHDSEIKNMYIISAGVNCHTSTLTN